MIAAAPTDATAIGATTAATTGMTTAAVTIAIGTGAAKA
jgi:hypothetical protein